MSELLTMTNEPPCDIDRPDTSTLKALPNTGMAGLDV